MANIVARSLLGLAIMIGLAAVIFAMAPWFGGISNKLDRLAAFFPATIPLTLIAFALGYRFNAVAAFAFLAVMLVLIATVIGPEIKGNLYRRSIGEEQLTLVTQNVKGFNFDPGGTAQMLVHSEADILLLQEWGRRMEPFRSVLRKRFPYGGSCGSDELQIFSRFPVSGIKCAPTAIGPAGQILVWSDIVVPIGVTITVVTLHPTWRLSRYWRGEGRKALIKFIHEMKRDNLIMAGDFNITPWNEGMRDLDDGLRPLRRVTRAQFTFPARVRGYPWPIALLPIDHIYVGPNIKEAAVSRLPRTGSDHFGLKVRLRMGVGSPK